MRAVAILVMGATIGLFACNSEATVCPNPAACDQTPSDAAPDADAGSASDSVTPDAAAETG